MRYMAASLEPVPDYGIGIINYPKTDAVFDRDETDRKFYDVVILNPNKILAISRCL